MLEFLDRHSVIARWGAAFLGPHIVRSVRFFPRYIADWILFRRASQTARPSFKDSHPCLLDRRATTPFDAHYFYQAAWLARRLQHVRPVLHVDVGSSAMMINVLSASVKTVFVDYRPLRARLSNLSSLAGDIVRLPFRDASIASLSCLHVIEHVGLGRYGDPINPAGSRLAAVELQRVVQPGGRLFLSAPVGRERVCFNAHRVHAPSTIRSLFSALQLEEFSLVDDAGQFQEHVSPEAAVHLEYGCGLFQFVNGRA